MNNNMIEYPACFEFLEIERHQWTKDLTPVKLNIQIVSIKTAFQLANAEAKQTLTITER